MEPSTTTLEALGLILGHSVHGLVFSTTWWRVIGFNLIFEGCFYISFLLQRLSTCPRPFSSCPTACVEVDRGSQLSGTEDLLCWCWFRDLLRGWYLARVMRFHSDALTCWPSVLAHGSISSGLRCWVIDLAFDLRRPRQDELGLAQQSARKTF